MTEIYISKNSRYYFKEKNLMRIKGERETSWEEAFYVSRKSLDKLLKKYKIPGNKQVLIKIGIGDKFLKDLSEKTMNLNKKGGRFVSLIEELDSYTLFYSSDIVSIKKEEIKENEIRIED